MRPKQSRFVARLLVVLLLLQPLLGGPGVWSRASAQTDPPTPLQQINQALNDHDGEALMLALSDPQAKLTLPEGFAGWDADDQTDVFQFLTSFIHPGQDNAYESLAQIQYVLNVIDVLYASRNGTSMEIVSEKIKQVLALSSDMETLFPNSPDKETFKQVVDRINALSPADRQIFDTFIQNQYVMSGIAGQDTPLGIAMMIFTSDGQMPSFGQPQTAEEMLFVLIMLRDYIDDISDFKDTNPNAPVADLGLNFKKASEVLGSDLEADEPTIQNWLALAQQLLDRRPEAGYASVADIQSVIDNFLLLRDVNAAVEANDVGDLLTALIDPALKLTLPEGFDTWSEEAKMSWAATFMSLFGGSGGSPSESDRMSYGSLAQVQYVSDLAAIPIPLLKDQSFGTVSKAVDAVFTKLGDLGTVFPEYESAQMGAQMKDAYNALTPVEKYIYKYTLYITLASVLNAPPIENGSDGDGDTGTGTGIGTGVGASGMLTFLLGSFSYYPQIAINSVSTPKAMSAALGVLFQQVQQLYEGFKQAHPDIDIEKWNLDLSKLNNENFTEETMAALNNWMLDKRPEGGYADLAAIQSTFDQFFAPAAPAVTADEAADKLVGADATMEYSTDNGTTWKSYDPENAPVFSNYVTVLVRVKENGVRAASPTTSVSFNVPYIPPSNTNTETLYVDVQDSNGSGLARTPVTRTTDASGKVTDTVTLSSDIAKEAVDKAKAQSGSTVRIVLPDSGDKVSEVSVNIPQAALTQLNDSKMSLELSTSDGVVTIPTASLSGFGQDLYFRLVPVKSEDGRVQIETRAKQEKAVQEFVKDESIKIYGRPMQIDTNMQSREATLFLPLKDGLPTDATERNRILNHLGIYAEHSDGTKELLQGKVVTVNNVTGIQFTVQKFSTFALVYMDGLNGTQTQTPNAHTPYINGFGKDFRPEAFVTRAQMAAMLARNLTDTTVPAGTTAGSDVRAGHWAIAEILKAKAAGIMGGIAEDLFDPEGAVTRAQMATIAARWLQKGPTAAQITPVPGSTAGYSDVTAGHWAADAISTVSAAGIMTGYAGQTFKPDQKLTRAEAVKVLNRLFDRGPLNGATAVTFSDVPATHWAYSEVEEAATNHTFTVDAQGAEHISAP